MSGSCYDQGVIVREPIEEEASRRSVDTSDLREWIWETGSVLKAKQINQLQPCLQLFPAVEVLFWSVSACLIPVNFNYSVFQLQRCSPDPQAPIEEMKSDFVFTFQFVFSHWIYHSWALWSRLTKPKQYLGPK